MLRTLVVLMAISAGVEARTVVFPHVLETSGRITGAVSTFDTQVFATYTGQGRIGLDLYLYNQTGQPMRGAEGEAVCNPCMAELNGRKRQHEFSVEELIVNRGGFDNTVKTGFMIVNITGQDPEKVALEGKIFLRGGAEGNFAAASMQGSEMGEETRRSWVIPHILEKEGYTTSTQFTFDTTVFVTYTPGLADIGGGGGATVDVYLRDDTGAPMQSKEGEVCNPCSYSLDGSKRKLALRIEDLILEKGGFDTAVKPGWVYLVAGGEDPNGVSVAGFIANAKSGPFDLGMAWINPQPAEGHEARTYVMPHVFETKGKWPNSTFTFDTTIFATYTGGIAGPVPGTGEATVELYLLDTSSGGPMMGDEGIICNPCTYVLSEKKRHEVIRIEELIEAKGFSQAVKLGRAIVNISGEGAAETVIHGQIVNTHGSPFDIAIYPLPDVYKQQTAEPENRRATMSIPLVMEKSGRTLFNTNTMDSSIYLFYSGGIAGAAMGNATVRLYLMDGPNLLRSVNGQVCAPCIYELSALQPGQNLTVENLIGEVRDKDRVINAYAFLDVEGDVENLAVQNTTFYIKDSQFEATPFGSPVTTSEGRLLLPAIKEMVMERQTLNFAFYTERGVIYHLEARPMEGGRWTAIDQVEGDGTEQNIGAPMTEESRFFRLRTEIGAAPSGS